MLASALPAGGEPDRSCGSLAPDRTATVGQVGDADTLRLDDGSTVRLVGALAPRGFFGQVFPEHEAAAKAALEALVAGRAIILAVPPGAPSQDRYGTLLAYAFIEDGGSRLWVQEHMLRDGHAVAYGLPGWFACLPELLAAEKAARTQGAGLWAGRARVVPATETQTLMRRRGAFQIVAGEIARVTAAKKHVYLDFGPDWREDFSVGLALTPATPPASMERLKRLIGRRVEVRGWIERHFGPYMELWDETQIVPLDEFPPAPRATRK